MEKMKQTKLLSVLLALLLVFALSAGTFAAEITIDFRGEGAGA